VSDSPPPSRAALAAGFATIYLVWGSTYLGIRIAVESLPPFLMASGRFLVAGGLLLGWLRLRGGPWPTAEQWRVNGIIGLFLLLGGNGGVTWAEQFVPSGVTALIIGIGPLFVVLTEWAWPGGKRPPALTFVALALGFAGVTWLAAPWEGAAGNTPHPGGVAAILLACASWGVGSIYSRHARHGAGPVAAAALQMLGGGLGLGILALFHGDLRGFNPSTVPAKAWGAVAYLIIAGSIIGYSTFAWLMRHSTPARVATYAYVNPLVAVVLGWAVLGEPLTSRLLVAALFVVGSVVLITVARTRTAAGGGD
jgi:drug/metabolite transporter (DMT)-like permease